MDSDSILAWHFCRDDQTLGFDDGRKIEAGKTLRVDFPYTHGGQTYERPTLCKAGLHGSRMALDALGYAQGAVACRVMISGEVVEDDDKLVGSERTVIAMADAEVLLHTYACDVAEQVLDEYGGDVDPRSRWAIEVKRRWLEGRASYEERAFAHAAASDAAWGATRYAAWAATRDAAWAAASFAAWGATRDAAIDAAWGPTRYAAWDAHNDALEARLFGLLGINPEKDLPERWPLGFQLPDVDQAEAAGDGAADEQEDEE